ncbi:NfeD family protein [candidate division WOR-3 bacterium]|nr:NfeD family protein [candidate division WOR-3 bacterium]
MQLWMVWLALALLFFILEIIFPAFFFMWFGVSSAVVALIAPLHLNIYLQFTIFAVLASVFAILSRTIFNKYFYKNSDKLPKTNVEKYIGKTLIALEDINNIKETGKVKIDGILWNARSIDDNHVIKKDREVIVEKVEGVTFYVKEKEE